MKVSNKVSVLKTQLEHDCAEFHGYQVVWNLYYFLLSSALLPVLDVGCFFKLILSNIFLNSSKVSFPSPSESSWNDILRHLFTQQGSNLLHQRIQFRWREFAAEVLHLFACDVAAVILVQGSEGQLGPGGHLGLEDRVKEIVLILFFVYLCHDSVLVLVKCFHEEVWALQDSDEIIFFQETVSSNNFVNSGDTFINSNL